MKNNSHINCNEAILKGLYIDAATFLKPIKSVRVDYD